MKFYDGIFGLYSRLDENRRGPEPFPREGFGPVKESAQRGPNAKGKRHGPARTQKASGRARKCKARGMAKPERAFDGVAETRAETSRITKYIRELYEASVVLVCHLLILLMLIFSLSIAEAAAGYACNLAECSGEILLFDVVPLRFVFNAIDGTLFCIVGYSATKHVARIFAG